MALRITTARPGQAGEDFARHRRGAVGDDQIDAAGRCDQSFGIERRVALVQDDLDQLLQARASARAP